MEPKCRTLATRELYKIRTSIVNCYILVRFKY